MEEKSYVYVVIHNWCIANCGESGSFVRAFNTHQKAKDFAEELFNEITEDLPGYEIEVGSDSYSVFKSGYYVEDHNDITIELIEVN